MYFATLSHGGEDVLGIAAPRDEEETTWAFYPEGTEEDAPMLAPSTALVFGGNCQVACDQAMADGPLWQRAAQPRYAVNLFPNWVARQ
jgi:hypothetical protein